MIRHELEAFGLDEVIARALADEGATTLAGATLWTVRGRARSILMGVRVALNDTVAEAIRRAKGKAITEASGGITLARIPALAQLGVDVISVGALTHSVKAADVGLDFA